VLSKVSLAELKAVVGLFWPRVRGNDSGLSHIAAALGCPVVAVVRVLKSDVWHPWTSAAYRVLGASEALQTAMCAVHRDGRGARGDRGGGRSDRVRCDTRRFLTVMSKLAENEHVPLTSGLQAGASSSWRCDVDEFIWGRVGRISPEAPVPVG